MLVAAGQAVLFGKHYIKCISGGKICRMSGTDTQTWYLEEIPGGEGDEEVGTSSTSNEPSTPVHDGSPNANQTRGITEVDLTAADTAPFGVSAIPLDSGIRSS